MVDVMDSVSEGKSASLSVSVVDTVVPSDDITDTTEISTRLHDNSSDLSLL